LENRCVCLRQILSSHEFHAFRALSR
jgi:hypothetical protein